MGYLVQRLYARLLLGMAFTLSLNLAGCDDVYLEPYAVPPLPVDLIISASGFASEGATIDVYLTDTGFLQTSVVSGGRFTVSFPAAIPANQLYFLDMQIFVDDDFDLCCDAITDTVFGYSVEVMTGEAPIIINVDAFDPLTYPSDCTFFGRCSP